MKSLTKFGAAAMHIEDQVQQKRCGHRPNKEIVGKDEMVDRIKAAADAKTDQSFVIMARTDSLAVEGLEAAIERACACVEAGADMIFPEAITDLGMYKICRRGQSADTREPSPSFGKDAALQHAGACQRERRDGALPALGMARVECRRAQVYERYAKTAPEERHRYVQSATTFTTTWTTTPTSRSSMRCFARGNKLARDVIAEAGCGVRPRRQ